MSASRRFLGVVLGCALLAALGCQEKPPPTYPVSGSVTFKGQPLPDGTIMFVGDDGKTSDPAPISQGKYTAQATAGIKKVQIRATRIKPGGAKDAMGAAVPEDYLPAKYNTETTLRAEVAPGAANVFDFTLEEK